MSSCMASVLAGPWLMNKYWHLVLSWSRAVRSLELAFQTTGRHFQCGRLFSRSRRRAMIPMIRRNSSQVKRGRANLTHNRPNWSSGAKMDRSIHLSAAATSYRRALTGGAVKQSAGPRGAPGQRASARDGQWSSAGVRLASTWREHENETAIQHNRHSVAW